MELDVHAEDGGSLLVNFCNAEATLLVASVKHVNIYHKWLSALSCRFVVQCFI